MKKRTLVSAMLILTMGISLLSGCSKKVTVQDVVKGTRQNSMELAKSIDAAVADEKISLDEVKDMVSKIPEGTVTMGFSGEASADVTMQGTTQNVSGKASGSVIIDLDVTDMELGINAMVGYGYDAMGLSGNQNISAKAFLIKEADGYYMYTQMGASVAERTFLGNLEDVFEEDLDFSEYAEEMKGVSLAEEWSKEPTKEECAMLTLAKETIDYNGKKCYQVRMDVTGDQTLAILKNNDEYKKSMEESLGMTFDEILATDIVGGITYADIFKACAFKSTMYVTTDDYTIVYYGIDMKEMAKNLCDKIIPVAMELALGTSQDMQLSVDVKNLDVYYQFDKADVDVKFTGDYKDVD